MSNTTRQNILAQIKTTLEGVESITEVQVNKTTPVDIETIGFPCAFIYSGGETRQQNGPITYETWEWEIQIELWARDSDMETLLGVVHAAMFADEKIGGYADTSYRTGVDMYVIDPLQSLEAALITYLVRYKHVRGTP